MVMPTEDTIPRPTAMRLVSRGEGKIIKFTGGPGSLFVKFPKLNYEYDLIKFPNLVGKNV